MTGSASPQAKHALLPLPEWSKQHFLRYGLIRQVILTGDLPWLCSLLQIYIQTFFISSLKMALNLQKQIRPKNVRDSFRVSGSHTSCIAIKHSVPGQDQVHGQGDISRNFSSKVMQYLPA